MKTLPDISKWDVSNVINMDNLFAVCKSLKVIPNILKWNIEKVERMDNIFYCCSFPDIYLYISKFKKKNKNKNKKKSFGLYNNNYLSDSSSEDSDDYFKKISILLAMKMNTIL